MTFCESAPLVAVALVACAGGSGASPEATVEAAPPATAESGALDPQLWPEQPVRAAGGVLEVWGRTEVPVGSRLQAARALADAVTRAELLKWLEVRVTSLALDLQNETGQQVELHNSEVTRGPLPGMPPPQHGWRVVRRGEGEMLEVVARLRLDAALLTPLLQAVVGGDAGQVDALVRRILGP